MSAPRLPGALTPVIFAFDGFELDEDRLELRSGGAPLAANPLLVRLLLALVRDAGQLVTKDELVERVWAGRPVADNVITVSMARLRQLLARTPSASSLVVTVYGRGYRFAGEVTARSADTASGPAPRAAELAPPFVGRQRVLERLRAALSATREGRGRLCALLGEPGIGKTRAVEMLEREADAGVRVAWGYCRQAGDTPPLWPWLRLLREIVVESDVTQVELERALGPLAAELRALLDEPGGTLSVPPSEGAVDPRRHHAFAAVLRTLALAAERAPRLLVLDDLHGADAASIELLGLLLDQLAHLPIMVVATLRTAGGAPPRPETQLPLVLGHRNCEAILLERLTAEEVAEYVAAVAGDVGGSLGRAVFVKSEGNPFFMVELSRGLPDADRPGGEALAVSKTALELLRQRLARLGTETREVLSAAAVIGRSFELSLLAAVTERAPDLLIVSLDEALGADVVVAAKDSTTAFEFGHELLRAALYDAQSPSEQRRWHLCIGAALERRASSGEDVPAAELAYHFHAALPEGDLRKTVDHCRRAAAAAVAVAANPDVVRYARRALQALDLMPDPSLRLRGQLLYMMALFARGDGVEFPRAIAKVIRLAREQGDGPLLVSAAAMLNPHRGLTALPGATEALERALTLLDPGDRGHDASRAVALAGLSMAPPRCYSAELAETTVEEAVGVARTAPGGATALRVSLESKLYLRGGPAHRDEARLLAVEVQRLATKHRRVMPVVPITLALHEALVAMQRCELTAASTSLDEAVARSRELRHGELLWHSTRARVLLGMQRGSAAEGAAELQALHRRAEQRPILGTAAYCAFDRVVALPELAGHALPAPIDAATHKALESDGSEQPSVWSMQVRALAAAGLLGEARAALRGVAPVDLAKLPCDTSYLGTLGNLARAALRLNELEHAEALYALLARYPDELAVHESLVCEGAVPQLLGLLARALGRPGEARTQLEAGLVMNERAGLQVRAAETRTALAELGPAARRG